jgi:serine/threonine-protein kinase RIO1
METSIDERILKSNPRRTLLLELEGATPVVVKRFHHPGRLQRLRDRERARNEHDLLALLGENGVRVPRPLGLARRARGHEVRMEWIEGARTLESSVDAGESFEPLARPLGRMLARLHALGIDHPDLHAENVLLDRHGEPWLVDLDKARRRRTTTAARMERDLAALEGWARERLSLRARLRFFCAWRAALPPELERELCAERELARRIASTARTRRRATIERAARKWLRESSRVELWRCEGAELLARRGRPVPISAATARMDGSLLVLDGLAEAEIEARWMNAARLLEHRIPAFEPLVLVRGGGGWAAFRTPERVALSERELARLLEDRGLGIRGGGMVAGAVGEGFAMVPPRGLEASGG